MKENICTIPINDIFMPKDGCPVCRMYDMLEKRYVEYITGAAMMEPTIRIETNKAGFCHRHFEQMVQGGNRLSNALILESHLQSIIDNIMPSQNKSKIDKKQLEQIDALHDTCFVCDKIQHDIQHFFSTVFVQWQNDPEFKELYNSQPYICLNHYSLIMKIAGAKGGISSKKLPEFYKATTALAENYLNSLKADITHFCSMFDYRNRGGDWGNSRDAIERSVEFLTSQKVNPAKNSEE